MGGRVYSKAACKKTLMSGLTLGKKSAMLTSVCDARDTILSQSSEMARDGLGCPALFAF